MSLYRKRTMYLMSWII